VFVALVAWLMAAGSEREAAFERFDLISARSSAADSAVQ